MASPPHVMIARARATAWGIPWLERPRNSSLDPLFAQATALLILGGEGWTLRDAEGTLQFSPGMAQLRIKRFESGFLEDMLLRLGELKPGDTVLDCTFGLGADALVAARVVGPTGRVVAIEKSLPLFAIGSEALQRPYAEGFAPIDVRRGDSAEVLPTLETKSVDVVLFDPMFGRPNKSSNAFSMLRRYADPAPLTSPMLDEARRVARRWVVIKGSRYSKDFRKFNLVAEPRNLSRGVLWARLPGA